MKFTIYKSEDGQYYYVVTSRNGQIMLTSETMKRKQSVTNAIKRIMEMAADSDVDDRSL